MSLEEVAAAASGKIGEIAPPCPDIAMAERLKEEGLPFGPCDLVPEEGAPVLVVDPQDEPKEDPVVCPGIILGKGVDLIVRTPCGPGADISDASTVKVDGQYCAEVTYIVEEGSESRTETLCEGDVPSAGGEPVEGPSDVDEHGHEVE